MIRVATRRFAWAHSTWARSTWARGLATALAWACVTSAATAQGIDCNRLAAQIAAASRGSGGGGQYAAAAQKQRAELARTSAYASSIGCDRPDFFLFGERPPQCAAINGQIARMQANLQGLQQAGFGGDGTRAMLQQRFDAYCRGAENYTTARGFFEQLFDTNRQERFGAPQPRREVPVPEVATPEPQEAESVGRGGSQALCVRTCDGGYFPLSISARQRDSEDLQQLCTALCPGTEAKLFTRVPGREVTSAVSIEGDAYANLPNALKFEKSFDKACTCKPADKSWAEALAEAERVLGDGRKGDIVVTPERAEELSKLVGQPGRDRRKFDPRAIAKAVGVPDAPEPERSPADALRGSQGGLASDAPGPKAEAQKAEGGKPRVRIIPQ